MGFYTGAPWCAFTGELIWHDAFEAVETWKNFLKSKEFRTSPDVPKLGALAIWMNGDGPLGHLGVVQQLRTLRALQLPKGTDLLLDPGKEPWWLRNPGALDCQKEKV